MPPPPAAGSFIASYIPRLISTIAATTAGLVAFGLAGAALGGANVLVGALRVLLGGWVAMAATYGVGRLMGATPA